MNTLFAHCQTSASDSVISPSLPLPLRPSPLPPRLIFPAGISPKSLLSQQPDSGSIQNKLPTGAKVVICTQVYYRYVWSLLRQTRGLFSTSHHKHLTVFHHLDGCLDDTGTTKRTIKNTVAVVFVSLGFQQQNNQTFLAAKRYTTVTCLLFGAGPVPCSGFIQAFSAGNSSQLL